mgnify:CR=1 FL=1
MLKSNLIQAVVVARDVNGVIRVAKSDDELPGIAIQLDGTLAPAKQIISKLETLLGTSGFEIINFLEPLLTKENGDKYLCYLIELKSSEFEIPKSWYTIADILRNFRQGKNRVTYNKVMQYMAGMANPNFKVVESDAELNKKITDHLDKN